MKKILALVILCVLATLCLCACDQTKDVTLDDLNNMINQDYSKTELGVKTVLEGKQLESSFTLTKNDGKIHIAYSIEQFAEISLDNVPDSYKKAATGTVDVENGKVVAQSGDKVEVALEKLADLTIKFNSEYFAQPVLESNKFSANVSNPAAFLGVDTFNGTNMTVVVNFDTALKNMTIAYTSANKAAVEMVYTFTK